MPTAGVYGIINRIPNEIGKFFRGHNILEYKSYGETVDAVRADDMTVSVIRDTKPAGLFRYFKEHGYKVTDRHKGIYEIEGITAWYPTQVIVTNELDRKLHTWLRALSKKLDKNDLQKLLDDVSKMDEKFDKEMASSVLEVSVRANKEAIEELIWEGFMFEALMEIMEPKIEEIRKEELEKGLTEGIQGTVEVLTKLGLKDNEIKQMIMEQYGLTEEKSAEYLKH